MPSANFKEPRYQAFLELRSGEMIPWGPKASKEFAEQVATGLRARLLEGCFKNHASEKLRGVKDAHALPAKSN